MIPNFRTEVSDFKQDTNKSEYSSSTISDVVKLTDKIYDLKNNYNKLKIENDNNTNKLLLKSRIIHNLEHKLKDAKSVTLSVNSSIKKRDVIDIDYFFAKYKISNEDKVIFYRYTNSNWVKTDNLEKLAKKYKFTDKDNLKFYKLINNTCHIKDCSSIKVHKHFDRDIFKLIDKFNLHRSLDIENVEQSRHKLNKMIKCISSKICINEDNAIAVDCLKSNNNELKTTLEEKENEIIIFKNYLEKIRKYNSVWYRLFHLFSKFPSI